MDNFKGCYLRGYLQSDNHGTMSIVSLLERFALPSGITVNAIRRMDGILYIANNEGLYYLDPSDSMIQPVGGNFQQTQTLGLFEINRVFLKIISNACYEANRKKQSAGADFAPKLTVCSRSRAGSVEIHIRDNGDGILMAVRDKLFTPFFTTKPTGQGTGQGLSISYDIVVHEHHGQISLESEEGNFTEFLIVLPRQ